MRKCSATHYIRLDFLEQVVLYEVNRLATFANEYEHDFVKTMLGRSAKVAENDRTRKQRELNALLTRDKELDMLFERLYENNVAGKIDDARFARMSKRYEQEQGEIGAKVKALRLELKKAEGQQMDMEDFLRMVRRYTHVTKITQRMVAELINHIDVYLSLIHISFPQKPDIEFFLRKSDLASWGYKPYKNIELPTSIITPRRKDKLPQ